MLCRAFLVALSSAALLVSTQAQTEQSAVHALIGGTTGLIYDGHFTDAAPAGAAYEHLSVDPSDSPADQAKHRGLLKFNGAATSYLDLSLTTGANSYVHAPLTRFGGAGSRAGTEQGVTFEMVVKFNNFDRQWAKTFDFSTGSGVDEVTLTMDGDNDGQTRILVEQYLNRSLGVHDNYDKAAVEVFRPNINQWYHIAIVMKPAPDAMTPGHAAYGSGFWYLYVNGQKLALSGELGAGAALTPVQAANYPLDIVRPYQYLSKSGWPNDPNLAQTIDAFRVYSYALSDSVISGLADYYGVRDASNPIKTPSDNQQSMPASPEANKHRTSAIDFDPVYSLDFGVNPASYVGGALNYDWQPCDPRDNPTECANHPGVARFTGESTSFVDLMAPTGPNSAGKVLPTLFGASSGTGRSNGWTIEMVVKPMALQTWSKYFSLGTGVALDNTYIGWLGGDNRWEAGNYNNLRDDLKPFNPARATFFQAPTLRRWQHLAMVMHPNDQGPSPKSNYLGRWDLYVNGQLVTNTSSITNINYPTPVVRRYSYLGASNWVNDAPANMTVDCFRIWDRALNAAQVESLSVAYGVSPLLGGDAAWDDLMTTQNYRRPVYNLDFQQNPVQNAEDPPVAWQWSAQDTTDGTVEAGQHTGLAIMDGSATSFMDLSASTGPNRAYEGLILPVIGGPSSPPAGLSAGWTIDLVFKVTAWAPWSKMFSLSDQRDSDEILLGFDGADHNLLFQNYLNVTGTNWEDSRVELSHPTIMKKWYHIAIVMLPVDEAQFSANYKIYINGNLQNWANGLVPDMTLTAIQGASYPRARARPSSFLAKSNWPDALGRVVFDSFKIYDYALSTQMVRSFANAYGCLETIVVPTPANNQALPPSVESNNFVSAGIQTAPVFNGVFSTNPASFVGGRTDYQWLEFDPSDNDANRAIHRGLLRFNGSAGSWASLTEATGPHSVGQVMPILGTSSSLTMECVVKLTAVNNWGKIIQLSNGEALDSVVIGWNGAGELEVHNMNTVNKGLNNNAAVTFLPRPTLNQWYHFAVVMERVNTDRYQANWKVYINGVLAVEHLSTAANNPATYPMPVYRSYAMIAKSSWNDPTATMLMDMLRFHESALTLSQVQATATAYGLFGNGPTIPVTNVSLAQPDTDESRNVMNIVGTAPVFNAFFGTNPTSQVQVSALEWEWMENHSGDDATQRNLHKGIARVGQRPEGQVAKFIDVTTNMGPNSCGQVLPLVGGPSSKTGAENGWSFEIVFKLTARVGWAKLFDFGNGAERDNIVLGLDGSDLDTISFEVWNDGAQSTFGKGAAEVFPVELNTWYHVAVMIEPVNMAVGSANWYFYVNGRLIAYADQILSGTSFTSVQGAAYPQADPRAQSYLGRSSWPRDSSAELFIDAMRVYDYRLTPQKVQALAALYGCTTPIAIGTPADNKPVNNGGSAEITVWDRASIRAPVFNANFAVDPRPLVGGNTRYTWMAVDSNDTAVDQGRHRGLIYLDGSEGSYVDLMTASGANSVGLVIPTLFGAGSGRGDSRGWTVEFVAKMTGHVNGFAKLVNFANGGTTFFDSWALSWRTDQFLAVENTNNLNYNLLPGKRSEFKQDFMTRPQSWKWMHITVVMQPADPLTSYAATWTTYVNGYVVAISNSSLAPMPTAVIRDNSYIGASQYGRNDGFQPMFVDALRVYDFALSSSQVGEMARVYGSDVSIPSSSSSKLSGGAIAGAVIGSIAGAVILGLILFCFCCAGAGRAMKKSTSDHGDHDMGNTGYGEVEVSQQSHVNDDEVEMQETETA